MSSRWPVLVTFFGPGSLPAWSPPDNLRPITYNNAKNWRLNGGTIPDDPAHPNRFEQLRPGDLALLRFRGDPAPLEVDVILLAAAQQADAAALASLSPGMTGRKTMVALASSEIAGLLSGAVIASDPSAGTGAEDPIFEAAIEQVALGGAPVPMIRRRAGGRRLTPVELADAKALAEAIGIDGEALAHAWLKSREEAGAIVRVDWIAQRDAAAPMDFSFEEEGAKVLADAKSTAGPFDRVFHLSAAELLEAASSSERYAVIRVYGINAKEARIRVAPDIREFARRVADGIKLPPGVRIDGFSIEPATLLWEPEILFRRPVKEE